MNRIEKKARTTSKAIDFNVKVKKGKYAKQSSEKENNVLIIDEGANTSQTHPGSSKKKLGSQKKRRTSNTLNNISNNSSNHSGREMSDESVSVDSQNIHNLLSGRENIIKIPEDDNILYFYQL